VKCVEVLATFRSPYSIKASVPVAAMQCRDARHRRVTRAADAAITVRCPLQSYKEDCSLNLKRGRTWAGIGRKMSTTKASNHLPCFGSTFKWYFIGSITYV
jgi:hypothetical protein